jgi:hypothetical protein
MLSADGIDSTFAATRVTSQLLRPCLTKGGVTMFNISPYIFARVSLSQAWQSSKLESSMAVQQTVDIKSK